MMMTGAAIAITLALNALQGRQDIAENANVRMGLYAEALKAISDRPFLGHGAGTYSSIEPLYHSSVTPSDLVWDNAHSTVLEVIATLGIPAALFAVSVLAFILFRLTRTWWNTSGGGYVSSCDLGSLPRRHTSCVRRF